MVNPVYYSLYSQVKIKDFNRDFLKSVSRLANWHPTNYIDVTVPVVSWERRLAQNSKSNHTLRPIFFLELRTNGILEDNYSQNDKVQLKHKLFLHPTASRYVGNLDSNLHSEVVIFHS